MQVEGIANKWYDRLVGRNYCVILCLLGGCVSIAIDMLVGGDRSIRVNYRSALYIRLQQAKTTLPYHSQRLASFKMKV